METITLEDFIYNVEKERDQILRKINVDELSWKQTFDEKEPSTIRYVVLGLFQHTNHAITPHLCRLMEDILSHYHAQQTRRVFAMRRVFAITQANLLSCTRCSNLDCFGYDSVLES